MKRKKVSKKKLARLKRAQPKRKKSKRMATQAEKKDEKKDEKAESKDVVTPTDDAPVISTAGLPGGGPANQPGLSHS